MASDYCPVLLHEVHAYTHQYFSHFYRECNASNQAGAKSNIHVGESLLHVQ